MGVNEALLSALTPVRECFDFAALDFDALIQRDIDDARVSTELIPYLLDEQPRDLIKLFPPIVVMVLPSEEGRNRSADYYPEVITEDLPPDGQRAWSLRVTRSGAVGSEAFQFEQPVIEGSPLDHDLVRLKVNTHRTRLVIIDGQHRAMALLAIYRNLKDQWSDVRRAPYKDFYREWTRVYVSRFNLRAINLPVMLCTLPHLDATYQGDFDLKRAARAIFLTLNRTIHKVSNSWRRLLDDNDLMAVFMRRTLSAIKQKDNRSAHSLRIWNVELDQFGDKLKIQSPIAVTGVNHVYYMIEHLMLDSGDVSGVAPRSGKFYKRTNLDDCLDRLNGRDELGSAVADAIKRDSFTATAAETLGTRFYEWYGAFVIAAFERFAPYERHNRAALSLEVQIEKHMDRQLKPILFEGQGIGRVFEAHRSILKQKLKENYFRTDVPEIEESARRLDATAERINRAIADFRTERATRWLDDLSDKKAIRTEAGVAHPKLVDWCNGLFENVLTTVAFQSALVCGFFGEFERAAAKDKNLLTQRNESFEEYIGQLNDFFIPRSVARLKKLIQVFHGEVSGDKVEDWRFVPNNRTFRSVVYRAEMQPDQWPKYKYLMVELWRPSSPALQETVKAEREKCRAEVFSALHDHFRTDYCRNQGKLEEQLTPQELAQIFEQALDAYAGLLQNLGAAPLDRGAMKKAVSTVPATAASEAEEEPEVWEETGDPV